MLMNVFSHCVAKNRCCCMVAVNHYVMIMLDNTLLAIGYCESPCRILLYMVKYKHSNCVKEEYAAFTD